MIPNLNVYTNLLVQDRYLAHSREKVRVICTILTLIYTFYNFYTFMGKIAPLSASTVSIRAIISRDAIL